MGKKRKPLIAPGPAHTSGKDNDDFTLPAALYHDAIIYYEQARAFEEDGRIQAADRLKRSAILAALSFFEALLNQVAFG